MCVGIILKDGRHLQTIREIEEHFKCNLEPYKWIWLMNKPPLKRDSCTCQVDLERFMNEPIRKDLFEFDYVEYYEK
jgi:hypothetical protein